MHCTLAVRRKREGVYEMASCTWLIFCGVRPSVARARSGHLPTCRHWRKTRAETSTVPRERRRRTACGRCCSVLPYMWHSRNACLVCMTTRWRRAQLFVDSSLWKNFTSQTTIYSGVLVYTPECRTCFDVTPFFFFFFSGGA